MTIKKMKTVDGRYSIQTIQLEQESYLLKKDKPFSVKDLDKAVKQYLSRLGFHFFECDISFKEDGFLLDTIIIEDLKLGQIHSLSGCTESQAMRWLYLYDNCIKDENYRNFLFYTFDFLLNNKEIKHLIEHDFTKEYGEDVHMYQARIENMVLAEFPYHDVRREDIIQQQKEFFTGTFYGIWDFTNNYNRQDLIFYWDRKQFDEKTSLVLNDILNKKYYYEKSPY